VFALELLINLFAHFFWEFVQDSWSGSDSGSVSDYLSIMPSRCATAGWRVVGCRVAGCRVVGWRVEGRATAGWRVVGCRVEGCATAGWRVVGCRVEGCRV